MLILKKRRKKWFSLVMIAVILLTMILPSGVVQKAHAAATATVAGWSFEPDPAVAAKPAYPGSIAAPYPATSGTEDNFGHANFTISGNRTLSYTLSSKTIYTNGWDTPGGYWQAQISTAGYSQLKLSSKNYGTATGPKDFQIQYSIDGGANFVNVPGGTFAQTTTIAQAVDNLALPSELDNKSNVYIRWINSTNTSIGGATTGTGNSRISEIVITGISQDGSGTPIKEKSSVPNINKITFPNLTTVVGVTGAVYGGTTVTATSVDGTVSGSVAANLDGSFALPITNPQSQTIVSLISQEDGKDPSDKIDVHFMDSTKTVNPIASKITFSNLTTLVGVTGAVYGGVTLTVTSDDNSVSGSAAANADGSFTLAITNPNSSKIIYVAAQENGKSPSDKVTVNLVKTKDPVVSKITLNNLTEITGTPGAVTGNAKVTLYFNDNTEAGTAVAASDGSFHFTFGNPSSKNIFFLSAQDNDKDISSKVTVNFSVAHNPGDVVFSQIYVNGGNGGAFYKTKFFELYNTTDQDINFNNEWAIIYVSATGTTFGAGTKLTGTIKAHGYFLVAGGTGATGAALPVTPDQTTTLGPSGSTGGVLALANSTTGLSSQDDSKAIDIIAYGNGTNPSFTTKTDHWGAPFYTQTIGTGTLLRKTETGSDPRVAVGLSNSFFTKNPSNDFVLNAPTKASNPEEVSIRNSKSMLSPDATKISFTQSGGNSSAIGATGSVPASSTVKAYLLNGGTVSLAGQVTALADGTFTLNFPDLNNNQAVYLTYTDLSQPQVKESAYAHVDAAGNPSAVIPIEQLRNNDANGLLLNIGYSTTIEGVVTTQNKAFGTEKTNFYIQDTTGGIDVIAGQDPTTSIEVGHKVKLAGKLVFAAGMTQFVPVTIMDEGLATTTPAATAVTLSTIKDYATVEPLEGSLVSVKGMVTNIPSKGPDYDVTITNSSGETAIVRILGTTGIDINAAVQLNDEVTFTGIVAQSQLSSPYTSGYYILPRSASDIKGDLQFSHTPLTKAYIGLDVSVVATSKYADSVTLYYKNSGDSTYESIPMVAADNLNYNAKIPKEKALKDTQIWYYIEAKSTGVTLGSGAIFMPNKLNVVEDLDGPAFVNELPASKANIESSRPVISVDLSDPSGVDTSTLKISLQAANGAPQDLTSKAVISETQIKVTIASDLAVGSYTVLVSGKDKLGNVSEYSWSFEIIARFTGGNHYRGTTHNHTAISHDAKGDPEKALTEAEKYGYDYFAFSDHSHDIDSASVGQDTVDHKGMPERTGGANWQLTKDLAKQYTKDGSFVVFPAFEMTSTSWGHSNVFGTSDFIDRVQDGGKYQSLQNYYAWTLTYDDIVAQFNHPAMSANAFDNFIPYDKDVDKLFTMLEVGNGSGHYSYVNADKKLYSALDLGWHVAPTYGEDNHDATWGQTKKRTVIVANDLSQESLLDAMRKMHVYFSEDPNFQLDVLANGYYMGATVDSNQLTFDITGEDPVQETAADPKYNFITTTTNDNIKKVELITNGGTVIDTYTPTSNMTTFNWKPEVNVVGGQQWFVVKVTQMDGDQTYSAPLWSQTQPLAVKVTDLTVVEGAAISGIPVTLKAGISNQGTIDLQNLTASFYYDVVDAGHLIGESTLPSLASNKSGDAKVQWQNPITGDHKLIVVLKADGQDLGNNKYEQSLSIKAPLGITVMIDATHNNENTTSDTGTYKDNLKTFTLGLKQEGYTVVENKTTLTDQLLSGVAVLMVTHPSSVYTAGEINVLKTFIDNGGSLLLTEKSNYGGTLQNLNSLLSGVGSSILVNNDGVFDESKEGNFWSTPLTSNFSVKLHLKPVSNGLTDFVPLLDFYSGSSLARNDGNGNKLPLTDSSTVSILASGNETTFQDTPQVKDDAVKYNVFKANGTSGPALDNIVGGSVIPLVASEQVGLGRIVVAGMDIFNDKQMTQNDGPVGNVPFELNVVHWLARQSKVTSINEARKLPLDTKVVIEGKVTTTAFYDAAYIQDATGGVVAFSEVPAGSLQPGDTVRVYGHVGVFENDVEIIFDRFDNSVVKVKSGTPVQAKAVTTKESSSDEYQGQLVQVQGKVISIPDDNSYLVNDGSGDVLVFVDGYIVNQSGAVPTLKVGDTLQATGLSGKYSEGSRIRVRDTKELIKATVSVPVTGVELDKTTLALTVGGAAQALTATVNPSSATNKAVTWNSSNTAVATVDSQGMVTPGIAGTATVMVTTLDGGKTATSAVTVTLAPSTTPSPQPTTTPTPAPTPVSVTGIKLDKTALQLTVGGAADLIATLEPGDASNKMMSWTSSDSAVATVDANGGVIARTAGTTTITVTTIDGNFKATSLVTVANLVVPVTGVTLNQANLTFLVGGAAQTLTATVNPSNATNKAVTWSSSNTAVATVSTQGVVTPGIAGTATLTVTTVDGGKSATSVVTVTNPAVPVTGVTLNQANLTFLVGGAAQTLTATVNPSNATNKAVTWSSSNTAVATVSTQGVVTPGIAGTATLTVTTEDGGMVATSTVTVTTPTPTPTPTATPSGGNGNQTPIATPTASPVATPTPTSNTDVGNLTSSITADKLTGGSVGKTTVEVPPNTREVKLPGDTADLIKNNSLEITSDNITMNIPSDLIRQLTTEVPANELKDSKISLKLDPMTEVDANNIVDKTVTTHLDVKLAGEIYEFHLIITTATGKTYELSKFNKPITIQLKVDSSVNSKLARVYYISETGDLEYVGGKYVDGYMIAEISHFSKYAVLQVTKQFTDVPAGNWAADAIQTLVSQQILNGTSETSFEPVRSVTRAEFTAMLVRALKLTEKSATVFTDVKPEDWYADAVSIAMKAGIVQGKSTTLFAAKAQITREEMVTMLMRAYEHMNGKASVQATATFKDQSQVSSWASGFVKEAAALELISGRGGNAFEPRGITTRAEAAQVVYNLLNK